MFRKDHHRINDDTYSHAVPGESAYPRVLLVNSQAIGQKSGVGATLGSLFRGWPQDRLAQIVLPGNAPDVSYCNNNWVLDPIDGKIGRNNGQGLDRLLCKLHRASGYQLSFELKQWITDFKPQLIYSYLELPLITDLVEKISHWYRVPVVPHLMDEWHFLAKDAKLSDYWWYIRRHLDFRKILHNSPFGLSISDAMAFEYKKRYKLHFYTFMNSANPDFYTPKQNKKKDSSPLRLVYAGSGPGLGRWPIIIKLAQAVQDLYRSGYQIEFTVFVRKELYRELPPQGDGFVINDYLNEAGLSEALGSSEVAVLPEGFAPEFIGYTRLSFSSKLPIYLMSGCFILAIGPLENNSIRYVKDNNLGEVVPDDEVFILKDILEKLCDDRSQLEKVCLHNRKFALQHHDQAAVHEKLRLLLNAGIRT